MIIDHCHDQLLIIRYDHWSLQWSTVDHTLWSLIIAMKDCWSYMINIDRCIISWPLLGSRPCSSAVRREKLWEALLLQCIRWGAAEGTIFPLQLVLFEWGFVIKRRQIQQRKSVWDKIAITGLKLERTDNKDESYFGFWARETSTLYGHWVSDPAKYPFYISTTIW